MTNYARMTVYNFSMDIIYIDRLFALNLILDYLLMLCTARLCGIRLRRIKYLLSAIFGAGYAALSLLPRLSFLSLAPIKLISGALLALIAYGTEEKLWRCCLTFFAVSVLFGGTVWAISIQNGGSIGGTSYLPVSMPVLVISFALIYAVLSFVFRRSIKSADMYVSDAKISFLGNEVSLKCLHDSGNALYDPLTGSCVLIAGREKLAPLFPNCKKELISTDCTLLLQSAYCAGRLRLIPYSAVGTQCGMLTVFRPDEVIVDGIPRDDIVVAISPTPVGGDGFDSIF